MDDIKLALLGDHEAAKRLTDAGYPLTCKCGKRPVLKIWERKAFGVWRIRQYQLRCKCGRESVVALNMYNAVSDWNTRAPILSAEEMEMLDEGRPD